jgi:hypothetical protein
MIPMRPPPLFVVPAHLTANIPTRKPPPPRQKGKGRFGPLPIYTKAERRRRHLKSLFQARYQQPKLDAYIARLEERLEILKEIRDELGGENKHGGDEQD